MFSLLLSLLHLPCCNIPSELVNHHRKPLFSRITSSCRHSVSKQHLPELCQVHLFLAIPILAVAFTATSPVLSNYILIGNILFNVLCDTALQQLQKLLFLPVHLCPKLSLLYICTVPFPKCHRAYENSAGSCLLLTFWWRSDETMTKQLAWLVTVLSTVIKQCRFLEDDLSAMLKSLSNL